MRCPFTILICLLCAATARAQENERPPETAGEELQLGSIGYYWENDGAYLKPNQYTDENYTNGGKLDFGFQGRLADRWARRLPTLSLIHI